MLLLLLPETQVSAIQGSWCDALVSSVNGGSNINVISSGFGGCSFVNQINLE